jgi:hypothetical protein
VFGSEGPKASSSSASISAVGEGGSR